MAHETQRLVYRLPTAIALVLAVACGGGPGSGGDAERDDAGVGPDTGIDASGAPDATSVDGGQEDGAALDGGEASDSSIPDGGGPSGPLRWWLTGVTSMQHVRGHPRSRDVWAWGVSGSMTTTWHFDGALWTSATIASPVSDLWPGPDGDAIAASPAGLWSFAAGAWTNVLPVVGGCMVPWRIAGDRIDDLRVTTVGVGPPCPATVSRWDGTSLASELSVTGNAGLVSYGGGTFYFATREVVPGTVESAVYRRDATGWTSVARYGDADYDPPALAASPTGVWFAYNVVLDVTRPHTVLVRIDASEPSVVAMIPRAGGSSTVVLAVDGTGTLFANDLTGVSPLRAWDGAAFVPFVPPIVISDAWAREDEDIWVITAGGAVAHLARTAPPPLDPTRPSWYLVPGLSGQVTAHPAGDVWVSDATGSWLLAEDHWTRTDGVDVVPGADGLAFAFGGLSAVRRWDGTSFRDEETGLIGSWTSLHVDESGRLWMRWRGSSDTHWLGAWDGATLRADPVGVYVVSVASRSATDVWAGGGSLLRPLLAHYDGTTLTNTYFGPGGVIASRIVDVAVTSTEVWVSADGTDVTLPRSIFSSPDGVTFTLAGTGGPCVDSVGDVLLACSDRVRRWNGTAFVDETPAIGRITNMAARAVDDIWVNVGTDVFVYRWTPPPAP